MSKYKNCVVIVSNRTNALELTALAAEMSEKVSVIAINAESALVNAGKGWLIKTGGKSALSAVVPIKKIVAESEAELVLVELSKNGRYLAAQVAAMLETSAAMDASALYRDGSALCVQRMVYGGSAVETARVHGPAVLCPVSGIRPAAEACPCGEVETLEAGMPEGITFVETTAKEVQEVHLSAAKRVVGLGRGIKNEENLALAADFAKLLGAELGCTRPVAEEDHFLPRERYIGVSGDSVKPALYLACGISGQIQHMAGVNESGTIIAINKDKQAPIFSQCDYGIVGDVVDVLRALKERL